MAHQKKRIISFLGVVATIALAGCLSGGGGGDAGSVPTGGPPPTVITTADFFHLAVVPDQTVTSATFEVQLIAENINPTTPPSAPQVTDHAGVTHVATLKTLKWPGTAVDSVAVYSAIIPLTANTNNNIQAVSGTKVISFSIRHKAALNSLTATNAGELRTHILTGNTDATVDVVEIDYNEPDLGGAIDNVNAANTASTRTTWLTIRPAVGRVVSWDRNHPGINNTSRRPKVNFLKFNGIVIGSDTADGGGYQVYVENNHRIWMDGVEFRAKYKRTWLKTTPVSEDSIADVRVVPGVGIKAYFTDCLWDGTATTVATSYVQLARDLRFNSHRGDYNNFGTVFLNAIAEDAQPARNKADTDDLHNDGFQIWGPVSSVVFKGLRVTSPNVPAELQPFLLDRTFTPNYSYVLLDAILVEGAAASSLKAQLAGVIANSRVSNLSFPAQSMTIRQDFGGASEAFAPTNVQVRNLSTDKVEYLSPTHPAGSQTLDAAAPDVSSTLNAIPGLSGATFTAIQLN
jgi:hypothetical protein